MPRPAAGDINVRGPVGGNPFLESNLVEEAHTDARDVMIAGERHEGDTHPKRLQTSGRAVIGKGIERDVDEIETLQMSGVVRMRRQNVDLFRGNASSFEAASETGAHAGIVTGEVFEDQLGTVNAAQDLSPGVEHATERLAKLLYEPNVTKPWVRIAGTASGGRDSGSG